MNDVTSTEESKATIRILIADDHELVRDGLRRMISREPGFEVVGEASDGREALELCRKLRPGLVLMDVRMPEVDGLAATRAIKREFPDTSVLMVTTFDNPDYLMEAIEAGAAGYVLKDAPKDRLLSAVRRTVSGESPLNQELAMELLRRLSGDARKRETPAAPASAGGASPLDILTPREVEVARLMARGKKNAEIARELVISLGTSKTHVQRIITKLGVSDRTQAVVRALELGLVDAPAHGR